MASRERRNLPGIRGEQISSEARERIPSPLSLRPRAARLPSASSRAARVRFGVVVLGLVGAFARSSASTEPTGARESSPESDQATLRTNSSGFEMVPVANGTPTDPYETIPTANAASGNSYEETPGAHETAPDPDESVESPRSASGSMSALAEFESVLAAQYGLANLKVDWSLGSSLARELAQLVGVLVAPIQPLPAECPDRVVVRLQGRRDDRPVEVLVPGELRVSGLALRALRTLRAGSVLRADDAERVQDWVPPSARCESEIEGRFLTTAVASGRWISCSTLRQPPLVRRGEGLVVIYRGPGLELRGRGVARKDGWLGEHVAVRVGGAERDCHAQVVGPGAVQVEQADGEAVHR